MDLKAYFVQAAFENGRDCRFDKNGNPFVRISAQPMGEAGMKALMEFINTIKFQPIGKG